MAEQSNANGDARSQGGCPEDCCGRGGSGELVGLCCMRAGQCGIVRQTCAHGADAAYLRALGLRRNQRIRLCRANGPWIVEVGCRGGGPASRIGLAKALAEQVMVELTGPRAKRTAS